MKNFFFHLFKILIASKPSGRLPNPFLGIINCNNLFGLSRKKKKKKRMFHSEILIKAHMGNNISEWKVLSFKKKRVSKSVILDELMQ